jgi:NitT/TauT family transport system permease protein
VTGDDDAVSGGRNFPEVQTVREGQALRRRRPQFGAVAPPIAVLVVALVALELGVRVFHVPRFLLPPPSDVFLTLVREGDELWRAAAQTALTASLGFAASAVFGISVAVVLSSARWVQRAFYPYAVFFQTVPIVAIAPLLVIWIGYGWRTVAVSAFIVSAFPVVANTLTGLLSTDPALRDLFRLYGASRAATLLKLRLPFALPQTMTGLRVAAGLAVIGAIVGEFIAGGGLGGVIDVARTQQRVDKVFAGILLASALGLTLFLVVNLISRAALRNWHASEQS